METKHPVLLIGFDGADWNLIAKLCRQGKMPALQSVIDQGCAGPLAGPANTFAGGVWPTMYSGKEVAWHGIYHNKLWRHTAMRCEIAADSWLPEKPFWENLPPAKRIAVIDVPMTVGQPRMTNGLQLSGWGTHDLIVKGSSPDTLWTELTKRFGKPAVPLELYGPQTAATLITLREKLLAATEQMADIGEHLLGQGPWDLFCLVLGGPHRAGHYLWDLSQIDTGGLAEDQRQLLDTALEDIYIASDRTLGRLLAATPAESRVMVLAVHGMGANSGWSERCAEMLTRIQNQGDDVKPKKGLLYTIKTMLPWTLIRQVTTRLPQALMNRLVSVWSASMFDWTTTKAFPLPMDHAGYIRINLQGREPQGIVKQGEEYEQLLAELTTAFSSFRDIDSGRPIVDRVYRMTDFGPAEAPYRDLLPDLVITWADIPAGQCAGIVSEQYGELHWRDPAKLPSGRAGNHRSDGWFAARGPGIHPGKATGNRVVDIVPTLRRWLDCPADDQLQGKPVPELFDR